MNPCALSLYTALRTNHTALADERVVSIRFVA